MPYWHLSAYYFCYFAFIGAYAPYFGLYLESLSLSAWQIGVLMSLMQVMRMFAPYIGSHWADTLGRRTPVVRASAAVGVLGFSAFFFTHEFGGMFAAMAVLAFCWGGALPLVEALTMGHLASRTSRYGRIRVWGSVGFILAVLGVGYLLDRMPLSAVLWVALASLAGIFLCALALPESATPSHASDSLRLATILRRGEVAALFAACFLMSAAHGALYIFLSIYLAQHGYGKSVIGWLWTLGVVAEIGVFLYLPRLQRRFSLRAILLFCFACAVLRFSLIGWGVGLAWVMVVAQLLHGATFGAYHAAAVAAVNRWFAGRHQARGQALYSSVSFGAGGMLGGLLAGFTWDTLGAALTFGLSALLALAGFLVVWLGWREPSSAGP